MGTVDEHLARASANRTLADRLRSEGEANWAVTVYFYEALHHASALLARSGINTEALDHITMEAKLDKLYGAITSRYLSLQGMSRRARYVPGHSADDGAVRRARQHADAVADFVRRVLAGNVPGL
jgi:hypothetical protein